MINEFEVPAFIKEQIPEIGTEMNEADKKSSVYKNMQLLLQFTGSKIKEHNYKAVKQCFAIAERLYEKGNEAVKNAVENVYVFSFTNLLNVSKEEKCRLLAIIPMSLYTLYIHQLHTSGC